MKVISKIWSDRSAKILFVFLIFIALVSTFLLIRSVIKQKEIENNFQQTSIDNNTSELQNSLRNDLDDLQEQYESLLDEYGNVNQELQYQDSIIRSQINEVKQLLRRNDLLANDLKAAKEKIISLQNIAKRYVHEILKDSLLH